MPKEHRSGRSSGYYRLSPATTPTTTQYAAIHSRTSSGIQNTYYSNSDPLTMSQQPYPQQPNPTTGYTQGGPVQHPLSNPIYAQPPPQTSTPAPLSSIRPSSGAWTPTDDQTLMAARAQGMNWAPIQQAYFPTKTPNACRKRHERLMERRSADDWDGIKLETLAKCYMGMRREIWQGLAAQTGEKWSVVEQKCMSQGLKNLQTAARSCARRERLLDTQSHNVQNGQGYSGAYADHHTDDSGISIDDLEAEYDADGASDRSSTYGNMNGNPYGHQHSNSGSSGGSRGGYHQHGSRLPSMDMGIDAIINRPNQPR